LTIADRRHTPSSVSRRHFALNQAQSLLPRVRGLLGEAMQLHMHLRRAVRLVDDAGYSVDWGLLNGEIELADDADSGDQVAVEKARALYGAVRERVLALQELGVEVRGVVDGVVDFASFRDGETEVWLSWQMGEEQITHYHDVDVDSGLLGRRPLGDHEFVADAKAERAR
jgi:hypothetical protein